MATASLRTSCAPLPSEETSAVKAMHRHGKRCYGREATGPGPEESAAQRRRRSHTPLRLAHTHTPNEQQKPLATHSHYISGVKE